MTREPTNDEEESAPLYVPLGAQTREQLAEFARLSGQDPELAAAALLRDLLSDAEFWRAALDPTGVERPRTTH